MEREKKEKELKKKKSQKKHKKENVGNEKTKLYPIEQILGKMNSEDYREYLDQLKIEFSKNYDARLKRFADYFLGKFADCASQIYFDEFGKKKNFLLLLSKMFFEKFR